MGAVYEARHRGTGRRVALKVISGASLVKSAEVVRRFQREAMASGAIESQYIAQILDTGVDAQTGSPYTVMELLVGEDLSQAIGRVGPLRPDVALRIVAQAGLGLRKAHDSGVVHRDIKPANLFLAKREEGDLVVKLLDFGIAKIRSDQSMADGGLTRTGTMLGSPLYMSPEQARGSKDIDHRTDIWSLGIVLYEALAGTTPNGHIESMGELIIQICATPARHVQELAPWVSPEVAEIVHRALALNPDQRFQSAAEMVNAVRAQLSGGMDLSEAALTPMSVQARAITAPKFTLTPGLGAPAPFAGASTTMGLDNSASYSPPKSRKALVLLSVGLLMAGVGGLGAWRTGLRRQSSEVGLASVEVASVTPAPVPPAASVVPSSVTPAPVPRDVRVVVLPPTASAQVDGTDVPVQGGAVVVTGLPASVHHVRLRSGRADQTFEVAIADDGPVPSKIELLLSRPSAASPTATNPPGGFAIFS